MEESNVSKNTKNNQKLTWKNLGCNHPFPTLVCFSTKTIKESPSPTSILTYIYQPPKPKSVPKRKIPHFLSSFLFLFFSNFFIFFYVFVSTSQKFKPLKEIHFHFFYFPSFPKIRMLLFFYVGSSLSICMQPH